VPSLDSLGVIKRIVGSPDLVLRTFLRGGYRVQIDSCGKDGGEGSVIGGIESHSRWKMMTMNKVMKSSLTANVNPMIILDMIQLFFLFDPSTTYLWKMTPHSSTATDIN
jgi:hypothetical protein